MARVLELHEEIAGEGFGGSQMRRQCGRGTYEELRELKREKEGFVRRSEEIVDEAMRVKRENEKMAAKAGEFEETLSKLEDECDMIWERVGDVEDSRTRREIVAMSIGVRDFVPLNSETKPSKSDVEEDPKSAQRKFLHQMILPSLVETVDFGPLFHQDSVGSRELQSSLEACIRKSMRKFGDEKRYIINTPLDEVVKGFPEVEWKWMFRDKKVMVPKPIGLHLYHGWNKWHEEAKADLKKKTTRRRRFWERVRDPTAGRMVSKTWYNDVKNRWEMDLVAVTYAASKKLIDSAQFRHDWGALKGDTKEYYVNIKEFERLFEEFGGFDGLYVKMLASGIPTAVRLTWVPFSELNFHQQFLLTTSLLHQCLMELWRTRAISYARGFGFLGFVILILQGVLIVGERGTGKTSRALAIAAEARVPVVKVEAQLLEAGLWVGQSASNVRELFQAARDLAPEIIFVKDFDLFAGVRGKFIHTKKQDHEAFINQLLVELDGYEKQDGVVLMATTRSLKQIDGASWLRRLRFLRPMGLKLVPVALEGSAFPSKFVDADELMTYCSWFALSNMVPKWIRQTKVVRQISRMLVNHLGLTLTEEDSQNVVDLIEPYGQINNGWTEETKFPHAVWAAALGLIKTFTLTPFLQGIGCTKITEARSEGSVNANSELRSYLEKYFYFLLGKNFLSSSELKQTQEVANGVPPSCTIESTSTGGDSPAIYYHSNAVTALSMGNNHAKVEKMYYLACRKAKGMLQKNHRVLENIVEESLEFEILIGRSGALNPPLLTAGGLNDRMSLVKLRVYSQMQHAIMIGRARIVEMFTSLLERCEECNAPKPESWVSNSEKNYSKLSLLAVLLASYSSILYHFFRAFIDGQLSTPRSARAYLRAEQVHGCRPTLLKGRGSQIRVLSNAFAYMGKGSQILILSELFQMPLPIWAEVSVETEEVSSWVVFGFEMLRRSNCGGVLGAVAADVGGYAEDRI
ncbi:hypothetical protein ACJRO7_032896 [Eucalyptus globulus]|uniref:AAA+ ATPase domain-containing protein n=1 Tax=Eucalyptus globulus TaxID=34317 RepID=A0ABD3JJG7_EUCGL